MLISLSINKSNPEKLQEQIVINKIKVDNKKLDLNSVTNVENNDIVNTNHQEIFAHEILQISLKKLLCKISSVNC